jgi:ribosomal protein S8E
LRAKAASPSSRAASLSRHCNVSCPPRAHAGRSTQRVSAARAPADVLPPPRAPLPLQVKKNPQSPLYTSLGVITKGTVIEVNCSDLGARSWSKRPPVASPGTHAPMGPRRGSAKARAAPTGPGVQPELRGGSRHMTASRLPPARPRDAVGQGGLGQVCAGDQQPGERRVHQRGAVGIALSVF